MKAAKELRAKGKALAKSQRSRLRKTNVVSKDASTGTHDIQIT